MIFVRFEEEEVHSFWPFGSSPSVFLVFVIMVSFWTTLRNWGSIGRALVILLFSSTLASVTGVGKVQL